MVRILHIFNNMGNGGIEHFVMNFYRHIDRNKVQFDFLTSVEEPGYFDEEIQAMGGHLYHAYPFKKNPVKNFLEIAKIVRNNNYNIVHRHTGSAFGYFDLRAAKHGGAKILILHSHASSAGNELMHKFSQKMLKVNCIRYACSKEAGDFLFGNDKYEIINNAIDTDKFVFSKEKREEVRRTTGVENEIVIGHVGAFYPVKNHKFLINVFEKMHERDNRYILWLIGDGETKYSIEQMVAKKGLTQYVKFWGNREDVPDLLQAMDLFVLPSKHEGFNIAAVEAQCAGLKCFVSAQCAGLKCFVSAQCAGLKCYEFIPLECSAEEWAKVICESKKLENRMLGYSLVKDSGYDIVDVAREMEERYLDYAAK